MTLRESLAIALYVEWCRGNSTATDEQARARWPSMAEFGQRPFLALADVAIAKLGRLCMACAHESTEDAEVRS